MNATDCLSLLQRQTALWSGLALETAETLAASAQVIGLRVGRMAAAGPLPSARDQREFALMAQEKLDAALASAAAMGRVGLAIGSGFGAQVWRDLFDAAGATLSLASSRSLRQSVDRQAELARTLARSAAAAGGLGTAGARIARSGLQPIHATVTANARRLARG